MEVEAIDVVYRHAFCDIGLLVRLSAINTLIENKTFGPFSSLQLGVWIEEKTFRTPPASPIGFTILAHRGTTAIALLVWCAIDFIARSNEAGLRRWARLATMVMGLTGGALYLIDGLWAYTLDVGRLVSAPAPGRFQKISSRSETHS